MSTPFPVVDVEGAIERLKNTALKVKAERDAYRDGLQDILFGAEMMLQPACNLTGAMLGYVQEVKRVAEQSLKAGG